MTDAKVKRTAWVIKERTTGNIWKPEFAWSPKVWFAKSNAAKALNKLYGGAGKFDPDAVDLAVAEVEIIEK